MEKTLTQEKSEYAAEIIEYLKTFRSMSTLNDNQLKIIQKELEFAFFEGYKFATDRV